MEDEIFEFFLPGKLLGGVDKVRETRSSHSRDTDCLIRAEQLVILDF